MTLITHPEPVALRLALDEIVDAHGLWPVLRALVTRRFRLRPARLRPLQLNDHLRRDIGLDPQPPRPDWLR